MTTEIKFPEITAAHQRLRPWLKASVKATTVRIHEMKKGRKKPAGLAKDAPWSGHVSGLDGLRTNARILTIAYGLVRGRKYEQIETKPKFRPGEWFSQERLIGYVTDLLNTQAKLYVAINPYLDMTPEQKAVQGAHAVAQFLVEHPKTPWNNGTLMFIDMPSLFGTKSGDHLTAIRDGAGADPTGQWTHFCEPDMGGKVTAVAIWSPNGEEELRLNRAPRMKLVPDAPVLPQNERLAAVSQPSVMARLMGRA